MKSVLKNTLIAFALALVGCSDSTDSQFLTEELLHAITNNDFRAVEELINSGADVNASFEGLDGWTPLIQSAYQGNTEIVKVLVSAGADLDLADSTGGTALMSACITGKSQTVKYLIFAGCDLNLTDDDGLSALHWAKTPEVAELLLKNGADVNAKDDLGVTPLMRLALEPRASVTQKQRSAHANLLREHGAKDWDAYLRLK